MGEKCVNKSELRVPLRVFICFHIGAGFSVVPWNNDMSERLYIICS